MYLQQFQDCDDDVIDVTESRGLELLGVVQSSGPVDGDVALAVVELHSSVHRGASVPRAGGKSFKLSKNPMETSLFQYYSLWRQVVKKVL